MKTWQAILFGLFSGLIATGLILWISSPPRGESIKIIPAPTPGPFLIYITGAVANPGVYEVPRDSRVKDVVQIAGGLLPSADTNAINLAAKITDGQKLIVATWIPTPNPSDIPTQELNATATLLPLSKDNPLNINTATELDLDRLPGIGPAKAALIVKYRTDQGPFTKIDDLMQVSGIGKSIFEGLQEFITVE
jgi:competence protein ComEA